ncbi:DUF4238 domain-containing protein [Sphingosinicella sp.]|uniref:DUF4238 domain-containing protein n=1 Tax=Sphingosinicella sp. TaxID=1917971 RepID=UPI0035B2A0EE
MTIPAVQRRTKDQHFVPRLHLQYFCGESPKNMIWTYSKRREKARPSRIEETGFQRNYYSIRTDEGFYHDGIDALLGQIENKAAKPYRQLLTGEIPEGQLRADFAVFVATCYSRSPALIRAYAEAAARSAQLQLRMSVQTRERFDRLADAMERDTGVTIKDRGEVFAFINDPSRYTLGISEKRGLRAVAIADDLAPLFYERSWIIAEAHEARFITSDNPVCRWAPQEAIHPVYGDGGFKNIRAQVSFPLSPTRMLVIAGVPQDERVFSISDADVWNFNRMRASQAEDLLFADRKDDRISVLAREFKDERPRMTVDHDYARDIEVNLTR